MHPRASNEPVRYFEFLSTKQPGALSSYNNVWYLLLHKKQLMCLSNVNIFCFCVDDRKPKLQWSMRNVISFAVGVYVNILSSSQRIIASAMFCLTEWHVLATAIFLYPACFNLILKKQKVLWLVPGDDSNEYASASPSILRV